MVNPIALGLNRIAVAGVSRAGKSPANAIAKRLRETGGATGRIVFAINPAGDAIDGEPTFAAVDAVEGGVDGVVVVTNPAHALVRPRGVQPVRADPRPLDLAPPKGRFSAW